MATAQQERASVEFPSLCHDALRDQFYRGMAGQNNPTGIPTSTFGDFIILLYRYLSATASISVVWRAKGRRMTRNPVLHRVPEQKERRLAVADPTWQLPSAVAVAIGVGIVYFLAARFSLSLLTKPDGVAVFWPASGVAAGVLIALGPWAKWPVAVGAAAATIAANLLGDRSLCGRRNFRVVQCWRGDAYGGLYPAQVWFGFRPRPRTKSLRIASGSRVGKCHLRDRWSSGVQVVPLLDCADFDHLAALVRIRRARDSNGCAAANRRCRGRARPSAVERGPRRGS